MRLVCVLILARQRVGQIGIEQDASGRALHEKTALAQPPQYNPIARIGRLDVGRQGFVGEQWLDERHSFSSSRTSRAPATMLASFFRAAQRAVWLKPQSGAKTNRSGGAYFRHARIRSATSSGVSM